MPSTRRSRGQDHSRLVDRVTSRTSTPMFGPGWPAILNGPFTSSPPPPADLTPSRATSQNSPIDGLSAAFSVRSSTPKSPSNRIIKKYQLRPQTFPLRVNTFPLLRIRRCHKVAHRLCSFITKNRRANSLVSYRVFASLLTTATPTAGLKVFREVDTAKYPVIIVVSDFETQNICIANQTFRSDRNYTVAPSSRPHEALMP